jgi:prevent-host-death family protein
MDRPISIEEAENRFAAVVREVADGGSFVVTDGGKPIARITPPTVDFTSEELATQAEKVRRFARELARTPIVVTGPWTREELYER